MKKLLLIGAAVAVTLSAGAQLKRPTVPQDIATKKAPMELVKTNRLDPNRLMESYNKSGVKMHAPKRVLGNHDVYYTYPAGAFTQYTIADVNGNDLGNFAVKMFYQKPFEYAALTAHVNGAEGIPNLLRLWEVYTYENPDDPMETAMYYDENMMFEDFMGYWHTDKMPLFHAIIADSLADPNGDWHTFQSTYWGFDYGTLKPNGEDTPNEWMALPTMDAVYGEDGLLGSGYVFYWSQKPFIPGGAFGDGSPYQIQLIGGVGAPDINPNENIADTALVHDGSWFGKNSGVWQTADSVNWFKTSRIDGFAQVFEKPERPYLLKDIAMDFYLVELEEPVEVECKVYKLDEVPQYGERSVTLDHEPGELIATGRATLRPEKIDTMYQNNIHFTVFTLYSEEDGDEFEITPTVDYPIMVTFEGYNDIAAIKDFTAVVNRDMVSDMGHGETAYLLMEEADENFEFHGDYQWYGLNNFFLAGEMKTCFGVFLNIDYPFLKTTVSGYFVDDEEYTFPNEGGEMKRTIPLQTENGPQTFDVEGIEFWSWYPSVEGDWTITWNGEDELPDWLDIELVDGEEAFQNITIDQQGNTAPLRLGIDVNAHVTAKPLPANVDYREATIRFEIPGEYRYYTFKQGEQKFIKGDVNGDTEVTIADINALIDIILSSDAPTEEMTKRADVNEDTEITVADINALINLILS